MVANGYGFAIANVRSKSALASDGRELVSIALAGRHKPMRLGVATLAQARKPKILLAFEAHCRELISDREIPGMARA